MADPEVTHRHRRSDARRNESKVRAAAELVFRRQGKTLSMDDVANEAGVSKGTVYNVWGSRSQLIDELTITYLDAAANSYAQAAASADPWKGLVDAVLTPTLGIAATPDLTGPDARPSPAREAWRRSHEALDHLLDTLKRDGTVRSEVTADHLSTLFRGLYQVLPEYEGRDAALAIEYGSIILRGIRA